MATQLIGKNFQSWADFDLTIDGLTVVVGSSNLGKSAFVRAAKGLVRNELNAGQVRVGSTSMEVTARIDGHEVIATRKKGAKGSVSYVVDGESFAKLGGVIPKAVEDLNLGHIRIGDVVLDPIFATQFGGQFLLELTPGPLTAILGAFSATDKLESGKKVTYGHIAEQNSLAKALAIETQRSEAMLATLLPMEERGLVIAASINRLEPEVERLEKVAEGAGITIQRKLSLGWTERFLTRLQVPDTAPVEASLSLLRASTAAAISLREYERTQSFLSRLTVPDPAPVQIGLKLVTAYTQALIATQKHNRVATCLKHLHVPDVTLTVNLQGRWEALNSLFKAQARFDAATRASTATDSVVAHWTGIVALHRRAKTIGLAIDALTKQTSSGSQKIIRSIDELEGRLLARKSHAEALQQRIRALEALTAAQQAAKALADKVTVSGEQLAAVEKSLQHLLDQQQREGLQEKLDAVRKEQSKAVVCGKCGEKIQAA